MTYEEISTKYPIGKLLARTITQYTEKGFVATEGDRAYYLSHFKNVTFSDNYAYYTISKVKEYHVEGWICDCNGFHVAENTWDGWVELDDEDLAEIEAKGIAYEF